MMLLIVALRTHISKAAPSAVDPLSQNLFMIDKYANAANSYWQPLNTDISFFLNNPEGCAIQTIWMRDSDWVGNDWGVHSMG